MKRKGRCKTRRKSMAGGRGTAEIKKIDNDCRSPNLKEDFAEKPLDFHEITEIPSSSTVPTDLYTQARKTLSFRSPYDSDDASVQTFASIANNLPTGVSNLLTFHSESKKRHKKLHTKTEKKSSSSLKTKVNSIWQETEEYFRELTVEDVDKLEKFSNLGGLCDANLLLTPCLGEDTKFLDRQETISRMLANDYLNDISELMLMQNGDPMEASEVDSRPMKNGNRWGNEQGPSNSFSGVEWLLGCSRKTYLSSERPTKKRKLSSRDAGLEKLHTARPVEGSKSLCHYCSYGDLGDPSNCLIKCSSCGMVVHKKCYGVHEDIDTHWLCSWCKSKNAIVNLETPCLLCPKQNGALKPVNLGGMCSENDSVQFAHLFCCLWAPEAHVDDINSMEPIMNVVESRDTRKRLICSLCNIKCGACIRCCNGSCRYSFHPICAREAKHRLEVWGRHGSDEVEFRAFCVKHSEVHYDDECPETGDSSLTSDCASNGYAEHSKETENMDSRQENGKVLNSAVVNGVVDMVDKKEANPSSFLNFNLILRMLIDLGKVNAKIVASEIDAPDSLTAMISDQDIDPVKQCKVVRWLISIARSGSFQKILEHKIRSLLVMKNNSGVAESVCMGSGPDSCSLAAPVKSDGLRVRNKSNSRVHNENPVVLKDQSNDDAYQGVTEKILIDPGTGCNDIGANDSSETEGRLKALTQCFTGDGVSEDAKLMQMMTAPSVLGFGDVTCASYMHPIVYGKYMEAKGDMLQEPGCSLSYVMGDEETSQTSSSLGLCSNNTNLLANSAERTSGFSGLDFAQLQSLKNSCILKLAPVDDVEGELMYYQQRLIGMTVLRKKLSDDLISEVVKCLPGEIANAGERKWDAVLVNQYNHNQREAKKLGRKERRHKEAQAVLEAATAAAASSSRLSSNRKDGLEESSPEEGLLKIKFSDSRNARHTIMRSSENSEFDQFVSSTNKNHTQICDVCHRGETILNPVLHCSVCKVSVHLDCYRTDRNTVGPWYCELCEELASSPSSGSLASDLLMKHNLAPECALCGGTAGAFRKSTDGRWMHAVCAEWILDSAYRRGQANPIEVLDSVGKGADICIVCNGKQGACLKCSYGHCHTSFHPTCARSAGFYMTARNSGGKLQHKAYCEKHSVEQRAKAEIQRHGIEELKNVKQIRVELEKLRLLCERIVKREKLKRELVLCSHDVLSSRRDSVLSVLARHPFYQSEVSSKSATTSLKARTNDSRSSIGIPQRADDITVDCTVAGKRRVRLPLSFNNDLKTDDSSTSPGKPREGISISSNQVSKRLLSKASMNLSDDSETQLKVYQNQRDTELISEQT